MASAQLLEPRLRRWTREEFHQLLALDWFRERNVELIDGEIVEMPAQGPQHYLAIDKTARRLEKVFGAGYWVRSQAPMSLDLEEDAEPNPDVSVVAGASLDYREHHPSSALLIVETSDSTLRYDRQRKAGIYAAVNVADYWFINLAARQLEVRRNPVPDDTQRHGFRYADLAIFSLTDFVSPLAAPGAKIQVADLMP